MDTSRDALFTISEIEYITGFFFFQISQRIHVLYNQDGKQQSTPCQVVSDDIEHIALLNTCMHKIYGNILQKLHAIAYDLKRPQPITQQKHSNLKSPQLANELSNGAPTAAQCATNYTDWIDKLCLPWIEAHDRDQYIRLLPKIEREDRQLREFYKNNSYPITEVLKSYDLSSEYSGIYSSLMSIQEVGKATREKLTKIPEATLQREKERAFSPVYKTIQPKAILDVATSKVVFQTLQNKAEEAMLPTYRAIQPKATFGILQINLASQKKVKKSTKRKKKKQATTCHAFKKLSFLINPNENTSANNSQYQVLSSFIEAIETYSASLITACHEYIEYLKKYEQPQLLCKEENVAQSFQLTTTEAPLESLTTVPSQVNTEVQYLASAEDNQTITALELSSPAALSIEWDRLRQQVRKATEKQTITVISPVLSPRASFFTHPS